MQGQISDKDFMVSYPSARITQADGVRKAVTTYGKCTVNYWIQHEDGSWTNYNCKTV